MKVRIICIPFLMAVSFLILSQFVHAQTYTLPDNIVTAGDCVVPMPTIDFKIKKQWGKDGAHQNTGPLVGDVDGDGVPEIFTISSAVNAINVFDGQTGQIRKTISIPSAGGSGGWHPVFTGVLVKVDKTSGRKGSLILATSDLKLTMFEATGSGGSFDMVQKWQTSYVNPLATDNLPQPVVADFNGDGVAEVVVYNQIFNAATGALLGQFETAATAYVGRVPNRVGNKSTNFMATADMDGDGLPEVIAGGKVYKITINAAKTSATCSIWSSVNIGDGFTAVADVDLDGKLDVVVVNANTAGSTYLNIWTPTAGTGTIKQQTFIYTNLGYPAQSYPFIGDIDGKVEAGKRYPEICVTIVNYVKAFRYNATSQQFEDKWTLSTSDASGGTAITLFDFNNDGVSELIYRDQTLVRILNGVADNVAPTVITSFTCNSGTAFEYPVIADTDGDGSANICVTCAVSGTNELQVFESATDPWAPTRKVWNQVAYDPVMINEDLTVPPFPMPKNRAFVVSGQNRYPFNGSLLQVPIMDEQLNPVLFAPDPTVTGIVLIPPTDGKTANIGVTIQNNGQRNINPSLPVSLYKNSVSSSNLLQTKTIGVGVTPTNSYVLIFTVNYNDLKNPLIVRLQDDGGSTYPAPGSYLDCDRTNNVLNGSLLYAYNDTASTYKNAPAITIDVLANDLLGECNATSISLSVSGALHGSATVSGNKVTYSPTTDYTGTDELTYTLSCNSQTVTGSVFIVVTEKPDNVKDDIDCFGTPTAARFDMKEKYNVTGVHSLSTPLVADLDLSDDHVDILAPLTNASAWFSTGYKVVNGKTGQFIRDINTVQYETHGQAITIGDVDNDGKSEIFIMGSDMKIYCYNYLGGAKTGFTTTAALDRKYLLSLADINSDGIPELVAGPYIYNARTGTLLVKGTLDANGMGFGSPHNIHLSAGAGHEYYMYALADFDNDGNLEMAAGTTLYKISIISPNNSAGNMFSVIRRANTSGLDANALDGQTVAVDFNADGKLDIAVFGRTKSSSATLQNYVWDPATGDIIAYKTYTGLNTGQTIPYIGNLDGIGGPELVYASNASMVALSYDNTQPGNMKQMHNYTPFGETAGFTVFDFNQDGKTEIVYRGTSQLYIVDGTTLAQLSTPITAYSGTVAEYPVVADVDGDGHAEIIVTYADAAWNGSNVSGKVAVFGSQTPGTWAPGRKVWNQWAYNVVNINEDMTIPKYPLSPAARFPNGKQPFNGFLQQVTMLNSNGDPLFPTPNVVFDGTVSYTYNTIQNYLDVKVKIKNIGDADLQAPFSVAVYKESYSTANLLAVKSHTSNISPAGTAEIIVRVDNISSKLPITNLLVRLNDDGITYPVQQECDYAGNDKTKSLSGIPIAKNDTVTVSVNVPKDIDVLTNDILGTCTITDIKEEIAVAPKNGTAVINGDKKINYTPSNNILKLDSIEYRIICGTDTSVAKVNIAITTNVAVSIIKNATEPSDKGKFRFYFTDDVTHAKPVRITYLVAPGVPPAVENTDYTLPVSSPVYTAIIPVGQKEIIVEVSPIDNFIVDGNRVFTITIKKIEEL